VAKLLIDNNLPPSLVDWLSEHGIRAMHVSSVGLANESDSAVWEYAQENVLSIMTKDTDFDRLALQSRNLSAPVFRLVVGNATKAQLFSWLESRLHLFGSTDLGSVRQPGLEMLRLIIVD
jgi:predicted nuclease of predicted toxin-antitoxin system